MFDIPPLPHLDPELGVLAATLIDSTREWRENLELPCQEAVVWQPYANGPSIGGAILHLASCETYWLGKFALGIETDPGDPAQAYDSTLDQYVPHWPTPPREPIEWYFEIHDRHRAKTLEFIAAHNDPSAVFARRDYTLTYRWMLAHVVEHDSYTGGQTVLLHEMWKKLHSPT